MGGGGEGGKGGYKSGHRIRSGKKAVILRTKKFKVEQREREKGGVLKEMVTCDQER